MLIIYYLLNEVHIHKHFYVENKMSHYVECPLSGQNNKNKKIIKNCKMHSKGHNYIQCSSGSP